MEEKPRTLSVTVGGVTLFSDEIRELAGLFSRRFGSVHIETDRYKRVSGDAFFEKSIETRPSGMTLTDAADSFPNFSVRFGRRGAEITASDTRAFEDAVVEFTRYLKGKRSWLARYLASPIATWASTLLIAVLMLLAVWLRAPERLWEGAFLSLVWVWVFPAFLGMVAVSEPCSRALVIMNKTRKEGNFWQRNRDILVVLLDALLVGAFTLAAAAITVHWTK